MKAATSSIRGPRRSAVRRATGVLALMLFAGQTASPLRIACDAGASRAASTPMAGMAHAAAAPTGDVPASAPAQRHDKSCDSSMAGNGCCLSSACAIVLGEPSLVRGADPTAQPLNLPEPAAAHLSLDIAPAVPPPRA